MKVFFSKYQSHNVEEKSNIQAMDVLSDEFHVSIRNGGIKVMNIKTKETICDFNLNLNGKGVKHGMS